MALTSIRARHFYDRLGRGQDLQAFYEDHAVGELLARGRLGQAHEVFEFGCGTGRLAARLLGEFLPVGARYLGADISDTMTSLSKARLGRFGDRAAVIQADGTGPLPRTSGAFDRFLAVYVLDLLGPAGTASIVAEARRLLRPGGLLEVVSLTRGATAPAPLAAAAELGMTGRSDADVFAVAADGEYALLTENVSDFARLCSEHVAAGRHHRGVLIALSSRFSRRPDGYDTIVAAVFAVAGDRLEDRLVYLENQASR